MGGAAIVVSVVIGYASAKQLTWDLPSRPALLVLFLLVGMSGVRFLDDFIKVRKQRSLGLRSKAKLGGSHGRARIADAHRVTPDRPRGLVRGRHRVGDASGVLVQADWARGAHSRLLRGNWTLSSHGRSERSGAYRASLSESRPFAAGSTARIAARPDAGMVPRAVPVGPYACPASARRQPDQQRRAGGPCGAGRGCLAGPSSISRTGERGVGARRLRLPRGSAPDGLRP